MKTYFPLTLSLVFAVIVSANSVSAFQTPSEKSDVQDENVVTSDGKIRFTFQDQPWQEVIPWFADQAGYSLQPISDWPEGTFNLQDDTEYTVLEAFDQLNHALRIHNPEAYTLIRNRKMLVLARVDDAAFPDSLIETVKVEDLDSRGMYETVKCAFDLGELNAGDLFNQLDPMISRENRNFYIVIPAANQIHIRETGAVLRDIRDLIASAKQLMQGDELTMKIYNLQHQDAETFLMIARGWLGIPEGQSRREDGLLSVTPEPLGNRLYVLGTNKMLEKFDQTIETVDVAIEDDGGTVVLDQPYLWHYPIMTDPKLAVQLLETMLEGHEGVRMAQDESTGAITVLGRAADHKLVEESLATISGVSHGDFKIIPLDNGDPADIIITLQSLFRQTGDEMSGPVLMANTELNHIIVRGTIQEVALVERMVAELDANSTPLITGPRSTRRIIEMGQRDQEKIIPLLEDLLPVLGRTNKLNIVLPEDRPNISDRIRATPVDDNLLNFNQQDYRNLTPGRKAESKTASMAPFINQSFFVASRIAGISPQFLNSYVSYQDEEPDETQQDPRDDRNSGYQPPPEIKSVSGAPINIKFTRDAMIVTSDDLDALDDLEQELFLRLGEKSSVQLPFFYFLKYRSADEMKDFLEVFYGMSDGGGGGGGGGGLMGGMMNNMLGGGAGDLLGGLLGGGGGGGAEGSAELEGDVRFGIDLPFNALYVTGATGNDIEEITLWIDELDKPNPPHIPELLGQTKTIDILYRDAEDVKEKVELQIPQYIFNAEKAQGGGGNNEAANMMKMVQQMTGQRGGRGGNNSADNEKLKPKAVLGFDEVTNQLLVTGPEFIYIEIVKIVQQLDKEEILEQPYYETISGGNNSMGLEVVKQMFPTLIEVSGDDDEGNGTTNPGGRPANGNARGGNNAANTANAARAAAIQNMMRAAQGGQRGGQRGGGQRGGGQRGGGQRGGGQRGGGQRGGR